MNKEWSLDVLYKSYEDKNYEEDKKELIKLIEQLKRVSIQVKDNNENVTNILEILELLEHFKILSFKLSAYVALRQSVNTSDSETVNQINAIETLISETSKPLAIIHKYIAKIENFESLANKYLKLKEYEFFIHEAKKDSNFILSDDVEDVIAKLNISAGSSWNSMQSYLTSTLEVDYNGKLITLSEVRNLAHSEDHTVRKEAFYSELQALAKIKDSICFSLNNIKKQVNTICDLRGYASPLSMTLQQARMKKDTLDALIDAIKVNLPIFHKYLKQKAKLLGYQSGLPWYDLFAPVGTSNLNFTVETAKDFLIKHLRSFSDDIGDLVEEAFEENWIDFYPRKGKVGGAFCENLPFIKQSRILANFTGNFNDVVTLAHELGHAYHGFMIQEHLPLNTDYSMPVAETASTFNEAIVMEAAMKELEEKEKITIIEGQLQDVTQIICDIYSRYLFETAVFDKTKNGFLFADELSEIMLQCQKEAYGDGLDHNYLHPYMWVLKGHYYSENLSFYNFPYAFGGLFARGLYQKYKEEGKAFIPKYRALLKATTIMSVENAAKEAEIDLENPEFWKKSLQSFDDLVNEFIRLSQ